MGATVGPFDPYTHKLGLIDYDGQYPSNTTLAQLDYYAFWNARASTTAGVLFGICLMTLLHLVVLTPSNKRRLPLFGFNVAALIFSIVRMIPNMLYYNESRANDLYHSIYAHEVRDLTTSDDAIFVLLHITAWPALLCTCACLFIQARTVMSSMKPWLYWSIMSYLLLVTTVTATWRLLQMVCYLGYYYQTITDHSNLGDYLEIVSLALYCVCIGSWSLVFTVNVILATISRVRMGITKNDAMNILLMTSIESMVIPILFLGLEYSKSVEDHMARPELVAIAAVDCLIPFGSLWASAVQQNASSGWGYNTNSPADSNEKKPLFAISNGSPLHSDGQPSAGSSTSYQARASTSPDNANTSNRNASDATERQLNRLYPELSEKEDGIEVRHNYSVTSAPRSPTASHHAASLV